MKSRPSVQADGTLKVQYSPIADKWKLETAGGRTENTIYNVIADGGRWTPSESRLRHANHNSTDQHEAIRLNLSAF